LAVVTIPIMYFLAKQKLYLAGRIGSLALRADAVESITCDRLSCVVVVGLSAQCLVGAWQIDAVTSLGILWTYAE
jgi:divalent metal cation (Fe/Co/Zn/Cd) transporter